MLLVQKRLFEQQWWLMNTVIIDEETSAGSGNAHPRCPWPRRTAGAAAARGAPAAGTLQSAARREAAAVKYTVSSAACREPRQRQTPRPCDALAMYSTSGTALTPKPPRCPPHIFHGLQQAAPRGLLPTPHYAQRGAASQQHICSCDASTWSKRCAGAVGNAPGGSGSVPARWAPAAARNRPWQAALPASSQCTCNAARDGLQCRKQWSNNTRLLCPES